jgi:hypothetical protein
MRIISSLSLARLGFDSNSPESVRCHLPLIPDRRHPRHHSRHQSDLETGGFQCPDWSCTYICVCECVEAWRVDRYVMAWMGPWTLFFFYLFWFSVSPCGAFLPFAICRWESSERSPETFFRGFRGFSRLLEAFYAFPGRSETRTPRILGPPARLTRVRGPLFPPSSPSSPPCLIISMSR